MTLEQQILTHLTEKEINSRGLDYRTAIQQTALAFELTEREIEQLVIDESGNQELIDFIENE